MTQANNYQTGTMVEAPGNGNFSFCQLDLSPHGAGNNWIVEQISISWEAINDDFTYRTVMLVQIDLNGKVIDGCIMGSDEATAIYDDTGAPVNGGIITRVADGEPSITLKTGDTLTVTFTGFVNNFTLTGSVGDPVSAVAFYEISN